MSKLLKVYKTTHHDLGEIIELYSPVTDAGKAFFVDKNAQKEEVGVGLRITKKTALKLAAELTKLAKGSKRCAPRS